MIRMKYQALFSLKNIFQMLSAVVVISALMVNIKNGTTFFYCFLLSTLYFLGEGSG